MRLYYPLVAEVCLCTDRYYVGIREPSERMSNNNLHILLNMPLLVSGMDFQQSMSVWFHISLLGTSMNNLVCLFPKQSIAFG